jgi:magnesium transporter
MTAARELRQSLRPDELGDAWPALASDERIEGFSMLPREEQDDFFLNLSPFGQAQILLGLPEGRRKIWMRILAPDDAADVLQEVHPDDRPQLIRLLDEPTRREVNALLAYAEDDAGGLMSPRFARVRPDMRVDEAIRYLQKQANERLETIYYAYVLDAGQRLLGVCSFRELFAAQPSSLVREIMHPDPISVREDMDQEVVARLVQQHGFLALPVVDADGRMKGIVTIDDIVDVVQEEATEDAQKFGGMEALDAPYLQTRFLPMIRKRAGWLALLFFGEMLTTSAMGRFEDEIARAVVLALFVPLIISSGGNSGSQASTLIIRAMALGEVKLRDWWRIIRRELASGLTLGLILASLGVVRILLGQGTYGEHYPLVAVTIGVSLVGVVTLGTLAGSMLPFVLRRLGLDPASASAPLVATLVDVSGLVMYFEVAKLVLGGTLLSGG